MNRQLHVVLPGDPDTPTGGYIYDKRMIAELRHAGWTVALHALGPGFPNPSREETAAADALLTALPEGAIVVLDGLCLGVLPEVVQRQQGRLCLIGLVHHPLAEETGLDEPQRQRLFVSERDALAACRRVIVTSPFTASALTPYGVPPDRIGTAPPGTDPAPLAPGSRGPGLHLISAASLTPRKGHDVLLAALALLQDRDWRLTLAGSPDLDPLWAAKIRGLIADQGLGRRVTLHGVLSGAALDGFYASGDVFVLASHYEGYGMVLAEALARGLPIVATTGGAIPFTVPADAGVLVPPGDSAAFATALSRLFDTPALRAALAAGARRARDGLLDWPRAALRFADEIAVAISP